jgi:hypothetical protein
MIWGSSLHVLIHQVEELMLEPTPWVEYLDQCLVCGSQINPKNLVFWQSLICTDYLILTSSKYF